MVHAHFLSVLSDLIRSLNTDNPAMAPAVSLGFPYTKSAGYIIIRMMLAAAVKFPKAVFRDQDKKLGRG